MSADDDDPVLDFNFLECSRGHGPSHSGSSGTATPLLEGTSTPTNEALENVEVDDGIVLPEKLRQRIDYSKAKIAQPSPLRTSVAPGLSKEHREQGKVKIEVYKQYIKAASKIGFSVLLLSTVAQQAASVSANVTLRYWGEHNRAVGDNSGMLVYLIVYGLFSLLSNLLGGLSSALMLVFCGIRSARLLHDSVSHLFGVLATSLKMRYRCLKLYCGLH